MANRIRVGVIALLIVLAARMAGAQQRGAQAPRSLRVYVFDCGLIKAMSVETYGFKQGEVMPKDFFVFVFNKEQSAASRAMIDDFLKKSGAQLWIEHDLETARKMKKAP